MPTPPPPFPLCSDPLVHSVQALEGAVTATEEELDCFLRQQAWLEEAYEHVNSEAQSQATPSSARELEVCAPGHIGTL